MATINRNKQPITLVIFGATGDLVERKLMPALFHLYESKQLPTKFKVIGFARRPFTDKAFRILLKIGLQKKLGRKNYNKFLKLFTYHRGQFDQKEAYRKLAKKLPSANHKLYYLATPPHYYDALLNELDASGLTKGTQKYWSRVIVEKPFGKDLIHAQKLDKLLGHLFDENQVYRIDHYLAKEVLQNIMAFRFANNLLEDVWNFKFIEKIEIKLLEEIDVEGRGEFYDGVGALLDVGQNHLLQMLALVTMDNPGSFRAPDIRAKRGEIMDSLRIPKIADIKNNTLHAQYKGYKQEHGVAKNSNTETYFKLLAYIDNQRWQNVPIYLEAGKNLPESRKEIIVTFKGEPYKNRVIFRIQPISGIEIEFFSKKPGTSLAVPGKPGSGMVLEKRLLHFNYEMDPKMRYLAEYARLISDAIFGDQTLFVSSREAISSWKYIDPIVESWKNKLTPLQSYKKDDKILGLFDQRQKEAFAFQKFGMIGLGKMGKNLALMLLEKNFEIVASNQRSKDAIKVLSVYKNFKPVNGWKEMVLSLKRPRLLWLMVPHSEVDLVLKEVVKYLEKGDIVVDSGNSFYKDTIRRGRLLDRKGIRFLDVGFSGGPGGARNGGCLMIGGNKNLFEKLQPLFVSMAIPNGYKYFGKSGAGHFVKMVHNGIEYGMMQSIAEGFGILKASKFKLNLVDVADIYNHGSVVESRLVGWLKKGLIQRGQNLKGISGVVGYTGEGEWTAKTAKELKIPAEIIEKSFKFRVKSKQAQSFVSKVVSAMREQFGGHSVK